MVEGFAETERNAHYEIGTLILSKGTLILLNRNSYYQKGTHQKGTLVLSKGTLIQRNTPIIK